MNCENCKYPTLCKAVIIGSILSAVSAGWIYYKMKSTLDKEPKPSSEDDSNKPDVNM